MTTSSFQKSDATTQGKKKSPFLGTGIIFVVFIAFLAYFVFYEQGRPATTEPTPTPATTYDVLTFASSEVSTISIQHEGEVLLIEKEGTEDTPTWEIREPAAMQADDSKVRTLIKDIQTIQATQKIEGEATADLSLYGLDTTKNSLTITRNNAEDITLLIGQEVTTGGSYYAQQQGQPVIFIITSSTLDTILQKTTDDLKWEPTPTPTATTIPTATPEPDTNTSSTEDEASSTEDETSNTDPTS